MLYRIMALIGMALTFTASAATHYHDASGLTFQTSVSALDGNWRVATNEDLDVLFGGDLYSIDGPFNASIAQAIIDLGGTNNGTLPPGFPSNATSYTLTPFLYYESGYDDYENHGYWDRNILFGSYYLDGDQWFSTILSYAGTYGETCDESCSTNEATLYVSTVPVPAAVWLFGSAIIGLAGYKRKIRNSYSQIQVFGVCDARGTSR